MIALEGCSGSQFVRSHRPPCLWFLELEIAGRRSGTRRHGGLPYVGRLFELASEFPAEPHANDAADSTDCIRPPESESEDVSEIPARVTADESTREDTEFVHAATLQMRVAQGELLMPRRG